MIELQITQISFISVVVTLWGAALLYLFPLRRRSHSRIRFLVSFLAGLLLAAGMALLPERDLMLRILLCYLFLTGMLLFCGNIRWSTGFYCGVWAMMTQQLIYEIILWLMVRGEEWQLDRIGWIIIAAAVFGLSYVLLGLTVARFMPENGQYHVGPRQLSGAVGMLVLFELIFFVLFAKNSSPPDQTAWGIAILAQFYCATVFYLQNELFKKSSMRKELDTLNLLWHQQKVQYDLAKENISLINRKCHDLKHQVAAMRLMGEGQEKEKYIREIEDSVRIYDCIVKTGNEVLDTILTEKSLVCEAKNITINCVADGGLLRFMDPVDLYTIFGNALDNAIEGVSRIQEVGKRLIDVLVYQREGFLIINVVNPMKGELKFEQDLPVTTKDKNGYHGFGLKSIRHTLQKYDGALAVDTKGNCFALRMVIPYAAG